MKQEGDIKPCTCKNCKHWQKYDNTAGCGYCGNKKFKFIYGESDERAFMPITEPDFFCADGVSAENGTAIKESNRLHAAVQEVKHGRYLFCTSEIKN